MKKKAAPRAKQLMSTRDKALNADPVAGQKRKSTKVEEETTTPAVHKRKRRRKQEDT